MYIIKNYYATRLTIKLITDINIIDQRWVLHYDHLGNIIVHTSGIEEAQVKDGFSHSGTLADIPVNTSCVAACSVNKHFVHVMG